MNALPSPRVAIVYDRMNTFGGAERVLQCLHEIYPNAPVYTSVYDAVRAPWARGWIVIPSFLQRIPWLRTRHQLLGVLMPLAFESFDFSSYDVVISVTSEAAKGIITKPGTLHLCYLLTPTRYVWNKTAEYENDFYAGWKAVLLPLHRLAVRYLRWWDIAAAQRPDVIIPISHAVSQRVWRYYNRTVGSTLYPPIDTKIFDDKKRTGSSRAPFSSFYLCVSRLVPYKRIDLAIEACQKLGRNLIIVGSGTDEKRLRERASSSPSIRCVGHLTDDELVGYYQQCTGLLFPGEEDFGITVLEAMAMGKPVVVFAKSGHAETVVPGVTGVIIEEQNTGAVIQAILALEHQTWDHDRICKHVIQFDRVRWKERWKKECEQYRRNRV